MSGGTLDLELLGSTFRLQSDDPRWIEYLTALWDGFVSDSPGSSVVTIGSGEHSNVLHLPGQEPLDFKGPAVLAEGLRYWLVEEAVKQATGVVPIHAATLARRGTGVLLVGGSGAGKTTLALALAESGWSLGSDDVAPLDPDGNVIHPFPKPLGVRSPGIFSPSVVARWTPDWPPATGKGPLLVASSFFDRLTEPFSVDWVFFIGYDAGSSPELSPLTRAQAVVELVEYVRSSSPATVAALSELCRGARHARLAYPSTEAATGLIERAVTESDDSDNPNSG